MIRAFRALWSLDPISAAIASLAAGLALAALSFPLGIAFVSYQASPELVKEVGYIPALNWSATLVFLMPGAVFAALWSVRQLETAIREMPARRMLAGPGWRPSDAAAGEAAIDQIWRAGASIGLFLFALALSLGIWDFWTAVGAPLSAGALNVAPGQVDFAREIDWSVAALLGDLATAPTPPVRLNGAFAVAAYLLATLQIAFLLSYFGLLLGLAATFLRLSEPGASLVLTPNAASLDRRRGFELFEGVFSSVLAVAFLTYAACYLMRVQNLFLRDPTVSHLDQLLLGYIADALGEKLYVPHDLQSLLYLIAKTILRFLNAIFATGDLADAQSYFGAGMILIGVLAVVLALFVTLRGAAGASRRRAAEALADPAEAEAAAAYYALPLSTLKGRLEEGGMDRWPLLWPRLNGFIAYLALGIACFLFYRLALLWMALQLWTLIRRWPRD